MKEQPKESFDFVRGMEFLDAQEVLVSGFLLNNTLGFKDFVGTVEGKLLILEIVSDELILKTGVDKDIEVGYDF